MKMSTRGQYALEIAVDLALHLMPEEHKSLAESVYACIKKNQI